MRGRSASIQGLGKQGEAEARGSECLNGAFRAYHDARIFHRVIEVVIFKHNSNLYGLHGDSINSLRARLAEQ